MIVTKVVVVGQIGRFTPQYIISRSQKSRSTSFNTFLAHGFIAGVMLYTCRPTTRTLRLSTQVERKERIDTFGTNKEVTYHQVQLPWT